MYTPFSEANQKFSDIAHEAARSLIYPNLLESGQSSIEYKSVSVGDGGLNAILDGEMAVDRLVKVSVDGLRGPLEHSIQERFRKPKFAKYRDITITEWNNNSGIKGELYKLKAGIFLYGYFDALSSTFGEVLAVDIPKLLLALTTHSIPFFPERNGRTGQSFICLDFDLLHDAELVLYHHKPQETFNSNERYQQLRGRD